MIVINLHKLAEASQRPVVRTSSFDGLSLEFVSGILDGTLPLASFLRALDDDFGMFVRTPGLSIGDIRGYMAAQGRAMEEADRLIPPLAVRNIRTGDTRLVHLGEPLDEDEIYAA